MKTKINFNVTNQGIRNENANITNQLASQSGGNRKEYANITNQLASQSGGIRNEYANENTNITNQGIRNENTNITNQLASQSGGNRNENANIMNKGNRNEYAKTLSASIIMFSLCLCVSVLTVILFSNTAFSQSTMNYQSGTTIDVQAGASVCADSVIISGTFTGGGTICGFGYMVNLTAFIEGFYDSSSDMMVSDTVTVNLRDTISPFAVVDTYKAVLSSSGMGTFIFPNAMNGKKYYLQVTHRNSIETWSIVTTAFTSGSLTYDFAPAITQAFGNNMKQVDFTPVVFAFFGGDVNQDGTVDASDLSQVENDAAISLTGYVQTDLNGDDFVDASDLSIVENNAAIGVSAIVP